METIIYRGAREDDLPQILDLQTRIFNGEQKIPAGEVGEFLAKKPMLWCALKDGIVVGAAAAWKEGEVLHWGRFVTERSHRGKHIGTKIAQLSFDELFSRGYDEVHMEAREATVRMVLKMGGRIAGEPAPFYEGTVTPVVLRREDYHHTVTV